MDEEDTITETVVYLYPNSSGEFYPNGTEFATNTTSVLYLLNDVICNTQPTYGYRASNLTGLPCSAISRRELNVFQMAVVDGVATLNETSANFVILFNLPKLRVANITVYDALELNSLDALTQVNLGLDSRVNIITLAYLEALPYITHTIREIQWLLASYCENLMGISLLWVNDLYIQNTPAFERFDIVNTSAINGSLYINTRSERFLNSRPLCRGVFTSENFTQYCLPVDNAPSRDQVECRRPIVTKCTSYSLTTYNSSCWVPSWNVTTFNISTNVGIVSDCVFDANHWFDVETLYVYDASIVLPSRIRAQSIVYLNTQTPTRNPTTTESPTKNPTNNPTKSPTPTPTNSPTRIPSKNPTGICSTGHCNQFSCGCVKSIKGVRCTECNHAGYLDSVGKCVCYSRLLNPAKNCLPSDGELTDRRLRRILRRSLGSNDNTLIKTKVECSCHFDSIDGFYKPLNFTKTKHKFGSINPPVCDTCITESYGPLPGTIPVGSKTKACTEWGGPDVNFLPNDATWKTCGGHGRWTGTMCECFKGWTLGNRIVGGGKTPSEIVKICNTCNDNYGPMPGGGDDVTPPYCSKVMTINPLTRIREECGGGGLYIEGICYCLNGYTRTQFENVITCIK